MTADVTRYRTVLKHIHDYLASFEDARWAPVLERWIEELGDCATTESVQEHARRTIKATGGMGSLGDLSISAANGHAISDDVDEIGRASETLWQMTAELYRE